MSGWQIDQAKLDQVGQLLTACQDVSNHEAHLLALKMLEEHTKVHPDFGCYLLVVFCKMPSAPAPLRHLAGIQLKNAIKVSKITKVAMTPGDAAGTSFTMTCGTTDYPFRADEPADAEAWVAVISKRFAFSLPTYPTRVWT